MIQYNRTIHDDGIEDSYRISYNIKVLESATAEDSIGGGEIVIGHNAMFGNMMFINDLIQIAECDMDAFHNGIASLIPNGLVDDELRVLVVGDGDGGYLKMPWAGNSTWVEPSATVRRMGTEYFGADWTKAGNIEECTYEQWLHEGSHRIHELLPNAYDAAIFAVTDEFMRDDNLSVLYRLKVLLNPGGVAIYPLGCALDKHTRFMKVAIPAWAEVHPEVRVTLHDIYCQAFFSTFVVARVELVA